MVGLVIYEAKFMVYFCVYNMPLPPGMSSSLPTPFLRREENNQEADPAADHTNGRVRADKHERQEFELCSKDQLVEQRAVHDQRDRDNNVKQRESVQEKHPWSRCTVHGQ